MGDGLIGIGEKMTESRAKPQLAAAFLCERIIQEKDDVVSIIRIVDTFTIQKPPADLPAPITPAIALTMMISFKAFEAKGEYTLKLILRDASGKPLVSAAQVDPSFQVKFTGERREDGVNVFANFQLPVNALGSFYFDVLVDGEAVTRVPFLLRQSE
jgi:hypothetical protein